MHAHAHAGVEIGTSQITMPCLPLFAACVGLIARLPACFAVLACVRFVRARAGLVPFLSRCSNAAGQL